MLKRDIWRIIVLTLLLLFRFEFHYDYITNQGINASIGDIAFILLLCFILSDIRNPRLTAFGEIIIMAFKMSFFAWLIFIPLNAVVSFNPSDKSESYLATLIAEMPMVISSAMINFFLLIPYCLISAVIVFLVSKFLIKNG